MPTVLDVSYRLEVVNISDVGCVREFNEDSTISNANMGLLVLADGMGGHNAGELASALAVTNIYDSISLGLDEAKSTIDQAEDDCSSLVHDAITDANKKIYTAGQENTLYRGMGTTVVVALLNSDKLYISHVGDSRIYRARDDGLQLLTTDHSVLQAVVNRGILTLEEALKIVPKNLVTRALGLNVNVELDVVATEVNEGDMYLLCSDGLTDIVEYEEIHLTLAKYSDNLMLVANGLVEIAKKNGGYDNISVILAKVVGAVT
ncbi:Protein serine/threonine phosphatase PrpC, regulation of stationary phase [uncultured Candidatus Thioglobus sp.]|nr:Protein serine/threonine phosphatase PrpC, regulation of stationary phase [uncultured Candidatus Thioglobus sp.]